MVQCRKIGVIRMKKLDIKSIVVGLVIGVIGASSVFATGVIRPMAVNNGKEATVIAVEETKSVPASNSKASNNATTGEIKSATVSDAKVYFNGNEVNLKNPLITVVRDESSEDQLYMPMSELLEYMQFKVEWNRNDNAVNLTMNGQSSNKIIDITPDSSNSQVDKKAIDIIQKTGNWKYIEQYLPEMSADGIKKVVEIYNSKHMNPSEHKNASDYIKN